MEQKENQNKNVVYRMLPRIDDLMKRPGVEVLIQSVGYRQVKKKVQKLLDDLREQIQKEKTISGSEQLVRNFLDEMQSDEALCSVVEGYLQEDTWQMRPVYNGTGVILHTGLGRAPLGKKVTDRLLAAAEGYSNLEYDLENGIRGDRCAHFEKMLCQLTGAEAAVAVNNNAGAVLLALSALSKGGEVVVSRGELVEIGGKFRIPDVMELSGAKLRETGTTNRTRISDYEEAVTEETKTFLKVHTSNYRILGFTEEVQAKELCELRDRLNGPDEKNLSEERKEIQVIEDLGSGVLLNLEAYGLPHEPTVQEAVQAGVDVVTFSGDKLLGGPQAGILVGKKCYIDRIRKHPLMRALRIDKFTAAALEAVLETYQREERAVQEIPVMKMLTRDPEEIRQAAERACEQLESTVLSGKDLIRISVERSVAKVGGGALPLTELLSYAVAIEPRQISVDELDRRMRKLDIPVIGRIHEGRLILDMRTFTGEAVEYLIHICKNAEIFQRITE